MRNSGRKKNSRTRTILGDHPADWHGLVGLLSSSRADQVHMQLGPSLQGFQSGPAQRVRYLLPRNLVLLTVKLLIVRHVARLVLPEVHNNLLCFCNIQKQLVCLTPLHQMFHIDQDHYCCIICKLYDVLYSKPHPVLIGQQLVLVPV